MLQIPYARIIPYPFAVVLEQYFDFEHVAHVHPATLGEYVLVENQGQRLVYDQLWPPSRTGSRASSRVVQTYQPPGEIWFEFVAGRHQGTKVHTQLRPHAGGTELTETYHLPRLPNWRLLRWLVAPSVVRVINRVWEEDLRVGVCIGGWPGVPGQPSQADAEKWRQLLRCGVYRVGPVEQFPVGCRKVVHTAGGPVLITRTEHGLHATHPLCPHTGGPLRLGQLAGDCLVCPWHGARFDVNDGKPLAGPTRVPLPVYEVSVEGGELLVEARDLPGRTLNPFAAF